MPSGIGSDSSDEAKLRSYRLMVERRHELEMRDLESRHGEEIQRLVDNQKLQHDQLQSAYDVQISQEAEALEEKLHRIRLENAEREGEEKRAADESLNKLKLANQKQIEEYRKNAEEKLEKTRQELQATSNNLHEQARKTARREREKEALG